MSKRLLHIVDGACRATLEEQDDPVIRLCHAMQGAGAKLDLLLQDNTVVYGVRAQQVEPLTFGRRRQRHAPDLAGDLAHLLCGGVSCFYVEEDAAQRGVERDALLGNLTPRSRATK